MWFGFGCECVVGIGSILCREKLGRIGNYRQMMAGVCQMVIGPGVIDEKMTHLDPATKSKADQPLVPINCHFLPALMVVPKA